METYLCVVYIRIESWLRENSLSQLLSNILCFGLVRGHECKSILVSDMAPEKYCFIWKNSHGSGHCFVLYAVAGVWYPCTCVILRSTFHFLFSLIFSWDYGKSSWQGTWNSTHPMPGNSSSSNGCVRIPKLLADSILQTFVVTSSSCYVLTKGKLFVFYRSSKHLFAPWDQDHSLVMWPWHGQMQTKVWFCRFLHHPYY